MDDEYNGSPLDEIQWRLPEAVAFFGGIKAENVHLYFMVSPFCLPTSNNKMLETQAKFNPDLNPILANRFEFETRIREMSGLEYLVADGPDKTTPDMNPVWVVRKQRRSKNPERVIVLGTYYVVAENIYQAPSLLDVLSCRLLNIEQNMQKLYASAASMQFFTPSEGYTYFPSSQKAPIKPSSTSRTTSRVNTPQPEASLPPTQSSSSAPLAPPSTTAIPKLQSADTDLKSQRSLIRSLNLSMRYGHEYMDTNPLLGEPGSLVFTSTEGHLQTQQAAKAAKARAAAEKLAREKEARSSANQPALPSPLTEVKGLPARKGSKAEKTIAGGGKIKRRKSRMTGSPDEDG